MSVVTTMSSSYCEAILEEIAVLEGVDPVDLEIPLYASIDPDALEAVLATGRDVTVQFSYAGYEVTVSGDGTITVD